MTPSGEGHDHCGADLPEGDDRLVDALVRGCVLDDLGYAAPDDSPGDRLLGCEHHAFETLRVFPVGDADREHCAAATRGSDGGEVGLHELASAAADKSQDVVGRVSGEESLVHLDSSAEPRCGLEALGHVAHAAQHE